jgi:hypothetical protein
MQAAVAVNGNGAELAVQTVVEKLAAKLSPGAKVITEHGEEWGILLERWTDSGKENPGAIVSVTTENDILETVGST